LNIQELLTAKYAKYAKEWGRDGEVFFRGVHTLIFCYRLEKGTPLAKLTNG
jgi:hypothetical protein